MSKFCLYNTPKEQQAPSSHRCTNSAHPKTYNDLTNLAELLYDRKYKKLLHHKVLPENCTIEDYVLSFHNQYYDVTSKHYSIRRKQIQAQKNNPKRVGLLGYYNHGKTTLALALAHYEGVHTNSTFDTNQSNSNCYNFTDRVITLPSTIESHHYIFLDCPGHATLLNVTESTVSTMDSFILVVSATDGIMEQTKNLLLLAHKSQKPLIAVFLNKIDMLTDLLLYDLMIEEIKQTLHECGYTSEHYPIISGSAIKALNGDSSDSGIKAIQKLIAVINQ